MFKDSFPKGDNLFYTKCIKVCIYVTFPLVYKQLHVKENCGFGVINVLVEFFWSWRAYIK